MYLFLDLLKESLSRSLTQIEIIPERLHDLAGVVVFKYLDLFDMLAVELDFQNANRFFNDWQHRVEGPCGPYWLIGGWTRLGLLRLVVSLVERRSGVRLRDLRASVERRLLVLPLLSWRLLLNGNVERLGRLLLLSAWRSIQEFLQHFFALIQAQVSSGLCLLMQLLLLFVIKVSITSRNSCRRFVGVHRRSSGLGRRYSWSESALFLLIFILDLIRILVDSIVLTQILVHGAIGEAFLGFLCHFD